MENLDIKAELEKENGREGEEGRTEPAQRETVDRRSIGNQQIIDSPLNEFSEEEDMLELPSVPNAPNHQSQLEAEIYLDEQRNQEFTFNSMQAAKSDSSLNHSLVPVLQQTSRSYEGCSRLQYYQMQKKIGSGTFGEVSLALDTRTGRRVALKRILMHNQKEGVI